MTRDIELDAAVGKQAQKRARIVIEMILGGLFGAGGMALLITSMPKHMLGTSEFLALALATMLAMVLVIILVTAASRRLMAIRLFDGDADDVEIATQRRAILYSAASIAALIPPLCILAMPEMVGKELGLTIIAISLAVMTAAGWFMWRDQDELHRMASLEGANVGLGIIFVGLILWAALDLLGFGVPFAPLPAVLMMILVVVVSSIIAAARRSIFSN